MLRFFSRLKERVPKSNTPLLASQTTYSPAVIPHHGRGHRFAQDLDGEETVDEEDGQNYRYEDEEGDEDDENDIEDDSYLLPIFSSAYLGAWVRFRTIYIALLIFQRLCHRQNSDLQHHPCRPLAHHPAMRNNTFLGSASFPTSFAILG